MEGADQIALRGMRPYARPMQAAKAQKEIKRHLLEAAKAGGLADAEPLRDFIVRSSRRIAHERVAAGSPVLHVWNVKAEGTLRTFLLHERGMDILRLSGDEDSPQIQTRFVGPQWGLDYREQVTLEDAHGGALKVEAVVTSPLFDDPIQLEYLDGNEDFDKPRRVLIEWARTKPV